MATQEENVRLDAAPVMAASAEKIETKFGTVTVLERKGGKIMVLIDDDITATFTENEFYNDFVL